MIMLTFTIHTYRRKRLNVYNVIIVIKNPSYNVRTVRQASQKSFVLCTNKFHLNPVPTMQNRFDSDPSS